MRNIVFLMVLVWACAHATAQDLVVTDMNDSINARITKENKKFIYFDFMNDGELRSTLLPRSKVATYQKDFFEISKIPENAKQTFAYDGERFRFDVHSGIGYRIGRIEESDPVVKDYLRNLRLGFHWGLDAHYFISEHLALGVKYSSFQSSNSSNEIQTTFGDGTVEQNLEESIKIKFVGPTLLTRLLSSNEKNALTSTVGIGYLDFKNPVMAGNRSFSRLGSTLGLSVDIGYELGLSETVSIGIETSGIVGALRQINLKDNGTTQTIDFSDSRGRAESLTHYNLSLGLKIHL